jgi:hypothetical protein
VLGEREHKDEDRKQVAQKRIQLRSFEHGNETSCFMTAENFFDS